MNKHQWLLPLFCICLAAAFAHAQDQDDAEEIGNVYSGRLFGPEIWRLPPVEQFPSITTLGESNTKFATPTALVVPRYEMLPTPKPQAKEGDIAVPAKPAGPSGLPPSAPSDLPAGDGRVRPQNDEKLWSGSFNLGIDGSQGTSETFDILFSFNAKRKTDCNVVTAMLDYNRQTSKSVATEDRLYFDGRFEQLFDESRWSAFFHETIEYDQFQSFDVRDTSDMGLGYRLVDRKNMTAIARLGGGFSHEYGGPDNGKYVPEIVFGSQFEWHMNKRQKFIGSVEYAPEVSDFTHYRIRTQAAWEVLLDEEHNLNLRIGVLERYNNEPEEDDLSNDLDYAMMLMWTF